MCSTHVLCIFNYLSGYPKRDIFYIYISAKNEQWTMQSFENFLFFLCIVSLRTILKTYQNLEFNASKTSIFNPINHFIIKNINFPTNESLFIASASYFFFSFHLRRSLADLASTCDGTPRNRFDRYHQGRRRRPSNESPPWRYPRRRPG